jgi:hypothetical protein
MLLLAWLGCFVFFDAYRAQSINVKAAYTLGDVLSRETNYVTPEYMDSLHALQALLTQTPEAKRLRVSVLRYDEARDRVEVRWSQVRGGGTALTTSTLAPLLPQVPELADGEVVILTETWVDYVPLFDVGIDPFTFRDLVATRPRFAIQLCWNTKNDGGTLSTATC